MKVKARGKTRAWVGSVGPNSFLLSSLLPLRLQTSAAVIKLPSKEEEEETAVINSKFSNYML
jgi:hypothetical protein